MGIFDFLKKKKEQPMPTQQIQQPKQVPTQPKQEEQRMNWPFPEGAPQPIMSTREPAEKKQAEEIKPTTKEKVVPPTVDGKKLKYHYDRVRVFTPKELGVDFAKLDPGDDVELQKAPDNKYDSRAVAVVHSGARVGYLNKGKLYEMANDYLSEGLPILAHIDSIDDDKPELTVHLAFFGSRAEEPRTCYKLSGAKGRAAQEAIEMLGDGAELDVEFDGEKEKYLVYYGMDTIGYLPKAAEKEADGSKCYVDSIETDDNGKYEVMVYFE